MPEAQYVRLDLKHPVLSAGMPLEQAQAAMVLAHGRGASAQDILTIVSTLSHPDFAYVAPQAPDNTWYPHPFTAPLERNEPHLSSSLSLIGDIVAHITGAGIPYERIMLLGFSQGACLTLEYAARHARRYGALVGLSGGLIGPDGLTRNDQGSLDHTPVFLGCSDVDPHIPVHRVQHAADTLSALGGAVTMRFYPNMPHAIHEDELAFVRRLMASLNEEPS